MKVVSIVIGCVVCAFGLGGYWIVQENCRLRFMNAVQVNEVRLLQQELEELRAKRTYEDGIADALLDKRYGDAWVAGYHRGVGQINEMKQVPTGVQD